jgi:hypothetical protein
VRDHRVDQVTAYPKHATILLGGRVAPTL